MTIISAEKWKAAKIITIELKDAVENLQSTPTSLPTSEPAESQISITLAEADLPVVKLSGLDIPAIKYIALVYAGGQNTDSASQTVYWRMLKNGASLSNGSFSVSASYYWTITARYFDVNAGDTIELRLWASSTNVNWDYDAHVCHYTRPFPYASGIVADLWVKTKDIVIHPTLSQGNPYVHSNYRHRIVNPQTGYENREETDTEFEHFERWTGYLLRIGQGDLYQNDAAYNTHSSYRPYYRTNFIPTKIIIRELK